MIHIYPCAIFFLIRPIYIPRPLSTGSCITHLWWRAGWPASFRRPTRKRTLHLRLKQKKGTEKAEVREENILGSGWNMQGYILSYPGENLHWQISVPNSEGPICEWVCGTPLWERKEEEEEREKQRKQQKRKRQDINGICCTTDFFSPNFTQQVSTLHVHIRSLLRMNRAGLAGVKGNDRADRLAGRATTTSG